MKFLPVPRESKDFVKMFLTKSQDSEVESILLKRVFITVKCKSKVLSNICRKAKKAVLAQNHLQLKLKYWGLTKL